MLFAQPLQLNRQGRALFLAHFAMRHAEFGPNHTRQSWRLLARLCKRAPDRASGWPAEPAAAAQVMKRLHWSRNMVPN